MKLDIKNDIVLLSHTDLDGYGSEIVLKAIGFEPTVKNLDNPEVDSYITEYVTKILNGETSAPDVLFITDIGPKGEAVQKLDELNKSGKTKVKLFDHHATALELNDYEWARVIVEENGVMKCGTSLFYQFLKEETDIETKEVIRVGLDTFVKEVELYDTWAWEEKNHESAKILNDLFWLVGHKVFVDNQVQKIKNGLETLFTPEEERLLEVEHRRIKKYLHDKNQDMVIIDDFFTDDSGKPLTAGVVQADMYISELGHYLCDKNDIDFALMLNLTHDKASLRAVKEDINLVPIVKRYNGGGHQHAAGCQITPMGMEFIQRIFNEIVKKQHLN